MDLTRRTDRVIPIFPFHPIPYLKSCNRNMKSIILVKKKTTLRQRVHHRMLKRWKTPIIGKKFKQFIHCFYMYMLSLKNKDDYTCFTLSSHTQEPDISPPPWQLNGKKLVNSSPLTYFNTASTISFHPWTILHTVYGNTSQPDYIYNF